ncbi:MAG: N-acetylmuramoyl-L-alanine amidase [Clostridia bacterium]|nr:N-acetylmuramoyl-L-alanine amidase [Clostridia bacterium]
MPEADMRNRLLLRIAGIALFLAIVGFGGYLLLSPDPFAALRRPEVPAVEVPDWVDVQLIPVDGASRRGEKLDAVNDIVIHYVGNPGTSAKNNRSYFANPDSEVSAHFVVGLEGEVILCVPLDEKSSASNWRNRDTISIEVCHPDETGAFTDAAYDALVRLTAWLCDEYGLTARHVIRHYDITGKLCPLYYVEHEDAWEAFHADVEAKRNP